MTWSNQEVASGDFGGCPFGETRVFFGGPIGPLFSLCFCFFLIVFIISSACVVALFCEFSAHKLPSSFSW